MERLEEGIIHDVQGFPKEIPPCSSDETCKTINEFLHEWLSAQESYFLYKRDMERDILHNEERIFELNSEIKEFLQANRNGRLLIEGMLIDIINNGNKE